MWILKPNIIESCADADGLRFCFMRVRKLMTAEWIIHCIDTWNGKQLLDAAKIILVGNIEVFSMRVADSPILRRIREERFKTYSGQPSTYGFWIGSKNVDEPMSDPDGYGDAVVFAEDASDDDVTHREIAAKVLAAHSEVIASYARIFDVQSRAVAAGGSIATARDVISAAQAYVRSSGDLVLATLW